MTLALIYDKDTPSLERQIVNVKVEAQLIVKTVFIEKFDDPELCYAYLDRQKNHHPQAVVTARRVSLNELPLLEYLILKEAHQPKYPHNYEFQKEDFVPLFERWRYSEKSITPALCRMHKKDFLHRVGQGRYILV